MSRIDFNRLRFLVIDDNAHMRRILRTLLHGFGAREVYEAEDGAAGLEAFTHYMPDIVITDWAMPIFDGLELTQMIRQPGANANPYVPIIMLTGHSEKKRVIVGARRRRHRIPGQADLGQVALPAHSQCRRQSAALHQDQDLFRSGPAAQRQSELCRPRAAQGRQGRRDPAAGAARKGQGRGLSDSGGRINGEEQSRQTDGRHLRRPRGHHAAATSCAGGRREPPMRATTTIRWRAPSGAGRTRRANSPPGWTPNASASTPRAAQVKKHGLAEKHRDELFHAAHDIKGEADDLRLPCGPAADSLCRLIEHTPDMKRVPLALIDQHVDAVRAIIREICPARCREIARALTEQAARGDRRIPAPREPRPAGLPRRAFSRRRSSPDEPVVLIGRYAGAKRSSCGVADRRTMPVAHSASRSRSAPPPVRRRTGAPPRAPLRWRSGAAA